jgi:anti-anti-sigma factor
VRNFRLVVDEQDDVVSMALIGELDMAEIEGFEGELQRIEAANPATLVLDLSQVVLIDSHGLSALLDAEARARADDRALVLVPPPDPVMHVFRITLLDQRFVWLDAGSGSVVPELSDAVGRLRRRVAEPAD